MKSPTQRLHGPGHVLTRGFSLVEMLVVIAVIGIIAAIAIPNVSGIMSGSKITVAKSRAQETARVFTAGVAARAQAFLDATNVREAQNAVGHGAYGGGTLSSAYFKLAGISDTQDDNLPIAERAGYYLTWSDGCILYDEAGGHMN